MPDYWSDGNYIPFGIPSGENLNNYRGQVTVAALIVSQSETPSIG